MKKKRHPPPLPTYATVQVPDDCIKPIIKREEYSFLAYLFSRRSVLARLCCSLLPPFGPFKIVSTDFEGTALSVFLLTCVMFHRLERPVDYNSLLLPSYYVAGYSISIYMLSFITGTSVTFRELVCTTGYGLFGHTLTLLVSHFSDELFIPCWMLFVGLSSMRIFTILFLRTRIPALKFLMCTPAAVLHIVFPMYLHIITYDL